MDSTQASHKMLIKGVVEELLLLVGVIVAVVITSVGAALLYQTAEPSNTVEPTAATVIKVDAHRQLTRNHVVATESANVQPGQVTKVLVASNPAQN